MATLNLTSLKVLFLALCIIASSQVAKAGDEPIPITCTAHFPMAAFESSVLKTADNTAINLYPGAADSGGVFSSLSSDVVPNSSNLKDLLNDPCMVPVLGFGDRINVTSKRIPSVLAEISDILADHNSPWSVILPVISAGPDAKGSYNVVGVIGFTITEVKTEGQKGIYGYFRQIAAGTP
jgi:hypothetical protein